MRTLVRLRTLRAGSVLFAFLNIFHFLQVQQQLSRCDVDLATTSFKKQRVYIASIHWNNEEILQSHWNDAVVSLAETLGPENMFISIYESGSWDESKNSLMNLDTRLRELGVSRNIVLSETTHLDEMSLPANGSGWIDTARGMKELRRIPYLAKLRNRTLQDLVKLFEQGVKFDRILFLNDVVFTTRDVLTLLDTNDGQYAAACSLDFAKPPHYYDTFALRDSEGHEHVMKTWPYFRSRASRRAMKKNLPVPVTSCWNGIVAMPTEPFTSSTQLRFRGVPDSLAKYHLEGSECCLIHADNPMSSTHGVYVNPKVRVGYTASAYAATHRARIWLSPWQVLIGLWQNRLRRWSSTPKLKEWWVNRRLTRWEKEDDANTEPGGFCLINEMQVLIENGWAHV